MEKTEREETEWDGGKGFDTETESFASFLRVESVASVLSVSVSPYFPATTPTASISTRRPGPGRLATPTVVRAGR